MPDYWYDKTKAKELDEKNKDSEDGIAFNEEIAAYRKPYFMTYVYPKLRADEKQFESSNVEDLKRKFRVNDFRTIQDLYDYEDKSDDMKSFLHHYEIGRKTGHNLCTINRICALFENVFPSYAKIKESCGDFDYTIMKSGCQYSKADYNGIEFLYKKYRKEYSIVMKEFRRSCPGDGEDNGYTKDDFIRKFKEAAHLICPNTATLCDIMLDLCYQRDGSKQLVWDIAGDVIISNLLRKNNGIISYPSMTGDDFEYCGQNFEMKTLVVETECMDDYFE